MDNSPHAPINSNTARAFHKESVAKAVMIARPRLIHISQPQPTPVAAALPERRCDEPLNYWDVSRILIRQRRAQICAIPNSDALRSVLMKRESSCLQRRQWHI